MMSQSVLSVLIPQFQAFVHATEMWAEAIRRRQIRRSYCPMTDAELRDIGLTAYDLEVALSLPLTRNASENIAKAAAVEAAKW